MGEPDRVVALASRILRRQPKHFAALAYRAEAWLSWERYEEALQDATTAVAATSGGAPRAHAAILACRAASLLGRVSEAVKWLGEAYVYDLPTARAAMQRDEVRRLAVVAGYA